MVTGDKCQLFSTRTEWKTFQCADCAWREGGNENLLCKVECESADFRRAQPRITKKASFKTTEENPAGSAGQFMSAADSFVFYQASDFSHFFVTTNDPLAA